jgi:hypothetical protein
MESITDSLPLEALGFASAAYEVARLPPGSIIVTGSGKGPAKDFPEWSYMSPRGKTGTMDMDELRGMAVMPRAPRKRGAEDDSPPLAQLFVGAGAGAPECPASIEYPSAKKAKKAKKPKLQFDAERDHVVYSWGDSKWYVEPDVDEVHIDMNPGRYFLGDFKYIRELTSFAQDAKDVFDEEDYGDQCSYYSRTRNRGSFYVASLMTEAGSFFANNQFEFQLDRTFSIVDTRLFSEEELKGNHSKLPGVFVNFPKGLCAYLSEEHALQVTDYSATLHRFTLLL